MRKLSKYKRMYGLTIAEMAKKYGGTHQRYSFMHTTGRLMEFIQNDGIVKRRTPKTYASHFRRKYGMTIGEMTAEYGGCSHRYVGLHERGLLNGFMANPHVTTGRKIHTSKYRSSYGLTLQQIKNQYKISILDARRMHYKGQLKAVLSNLHKNDEKKMLMR